MQNCQYFSDILQTEIPTHVRHTTSSFHCDQYLQRFRSANSWL